MTDPSYNFQNIKANLLLANNTMEGLHNRLRNVSSHFYCFFIGIPPNSNSIL